MLEKPVFERAAAPPTLWLSLGVVALAGVVDAVTFLQYNRLYVSFMSGNSTALGVALSTASHHEAARLGLVIGLFVVGVALGTGLHRASGRWPAAVVLVVVAACLLLAYGWPPLAIASLALGMGVLNASVHQLGGVNVSLTYVTGTLVKVGTGLADWLGGRPGPHDWLWQALGWSCFLVGVAAGALSFLHLGTLTLALAAAGALGLAGAARRVPGA